MRCFYLRKINDPQIQKMSAHQKRFRPPKNVNAHDLEHNSTFEVVWASNTGKLKSLALRYVNLGSGGSPKILVPF